MNNDLLHNCALVSAFISCVIAQGLKPIISYIVGDKFDMRRALSTGGMPSSHTSTVVALSTSVGMTQGIGSIDFAICFVFSIIVIHDAMGIRKEAGKQAELINEWSKIFTEAHKEGQFTQANLKTMLGHTFPQVFFGFLLGVIVGVLTTYQLLN